MKKYLKLFTISTLITIVLMNLTACSDLADALVGLVTTLATGAIGFFAIIFIIGIIVIIIVAIVKNEKEEEQAEAERKRQEEEAEAERKRQEEEEWSKSTKCVICDKCSMGNYLCENCFNRAKKIANETQTPKNCNNRFEFIFNKYKSLHMSVINSCNEQDRIYNASKLVSTALELKNDYFMENITEDTYAFLEELKEINYEPNDAFLKKYKKYSEESTSKQIEKETFDTSGKTYKCTDGDYVRSKAEREIDNFFYANRIWHIYEYKYEHPVTQEWAIPDFYLPDYNLFIEYFGLDTPEYIEKREHKIKMYNSDKSIRFDYLTFEDDADINAKLIEISKKHNIPLK